MSGGGMSNQISNWAGGGATTTLGAAQLLYGMSQQKKNKRPEYVIPEEIGQNLNQAQQQALQGLPEAQKQQYLNNLQQSTAYALQQSSSRKGGLTGIAALNQQNIQGNQNLLAMDAQARMQNQQQLMAKRNQMADYKQQAFQLNSLNPYYEKTAQNQALMGAGMQNVSQGFQASNNGNVDWGGGAQNNQPQVQKSFYTADANSPQGMVNYGGANSPAYNQNLYNYQGQQFNTGMS